MATFPKNFTIHINASSGGGPGTGPAFAQPSGGQSLPNGKVASSSIQYDPAPPVTSDYTVAIKTYFDFYSSRPGEEGIFLSRLGAGFLGEGVYLYSPDVANTFSANGLPATDPNNNSIAGIRLNITWITAGPLVTTPVRWFLYVESGQDNSEMYTVINDFSKSRGDTFAVTPNLPGRYVLKNETWGSWLDFTADGSGPSGFGLGWVAFNGVQLTQSDIGNTPF